MTIPSNVPRVTYLGDNVSTVFPVGIQAYLDTDFTVLKQTTGGAVLTLVEGVDYSLATASADTPPKWTLTKATALLTGEVLSVILDPDQVNNTQFVQGQAFPSSAVQQEFDRLTQMVQRLTDQLSRTIHGSDVDLLVFNSLPSVAARKNLGLLFDGFGQPTVGALAGQVLFLPQLVFYGVDSGATNAYVVTCTTNIPLNLTTGVLVRFQAANANSGASTVNINGLGVLAILGVTGAPLTGGELSTTSPNWIQYNGSAWQIATPGISAAQVAATYAPLASPTFTGTPLIPGPTAGTQRIGYLDVPLGAGGAIQTANYQLVLADRSTCIQMNGSALTLTIPANATVAFPIGTRIEGTNLNASNLSVAITTDTLTKAGTTTVGTRTVGQNGKFLLSKETATGWMISGSAVT